MLNKYERREIRREGLKNLKRRYYLNIIIVFIVAVIVNGGYQLATRKLDYPVDKTIDKAVNAVESSDNINIMGLISGHSNADTIMNFIFNIFHVDEVPDPNSISTTSAKYYGGVASVFVNEITGSQSFIFGIINGINEVAFKGKIASSIVMFVFAIISIFIFIYLKNVIIVGQNRYFLEQRRYHATGPGELLFPYKNSRLKNISSIMFLRYVFQTLWNFTIVGGVIKHYEYLLIPYILAENPRVGKKEAFQISKQLMDGNKYRAFLIEFSFVPWYLLSYVTYNLSGLFFSDAYIECVRAEMYMRIRNAKKDELPIELRKFLVDNLLAIDHIEEGEHPSGMEVLNLPTVDIHTIKYDYMRKYSFISLVQLFFTYSLVGWIWEVGLYLASTGNFVNRGTMHGPWLPIYGCGGLLIILLLKPLRTKPAALFFGAVGICGAVEYFTSWFLEKIFDAKWWDYTGYFLNINGRICFEGLLVFGMAGFAFTYILSPMIDDFYARINIKYRKIICYIFIIIFILDFIWSLISPNTGNGVTTGLV